MDDEAITSSKKIEYKGLSECVEETTESMVLEFRKHVRDGDLKLVIIGILKVIQVTGLYEFSQGENMEGMEMT